MANETMLSTKGDARGLLGRILEQPRLVAAVQALEPRALLGLIDHVGLEDAGEIIALATVDQLRRVFDEDLWQSPRPGEAERFDARRFLVWLEVLLEAGEAFAASKLAELPEDLVALALSQHLLVIDLDALALQMGADPDDDEQLEKALESSLHHEFGPYRVIARRHDGWDSLVALLSGLERHDPDALDRLLARLCHASTEHIDDNGGLYEVLTSEEMLESDAAAEREDRRARAGYVAPASAASFLALARTGEIDAVLAETAQDPITRAYFRDYEPEAVASEAAAAEASEEAARLLDLVEAEAPAERRPPPLLEAPRPGPEGLLVRTLGELGARDADRYAARVAELAYLANVLLAGASRAGAPFRPFDAAQAALATCNLGLARAVEAGGEPPVEVLARTGCDRLFRVGYRLLWDQVSRPAAAAVARLAARLAAEAADPAPLRHLARAAESAGDRPWSLRPRLAPLAGALDALSLARLDALLDRHPTWLPAAEAPPAPIATGAELQSIGAFLGGLLAA